VMLVRDISVPPKSAFGPGSVAARPGGLSRKPEPP
jgi:hypothetical protein